MVIGTNDGGVMLFDPILRGKHIFNRYHHGFEKRKQVDLVRWLEKAPNRTHSSRFLVVFSDGTISFFHKDAPVPSNMPNPDPTKEP
jgi:hypothetical protein